VRPTRIGAGPARAAPRAGVLVLGAVVGGMGVFGIAGPGRAAGQELDPFDPAPPAPDPPTAELWREVRSPGWLRSRVLLRQGRERLATAGRAQVFGRNESFVQAHFASACARFERARGLAPTDPEATWYLASCFQLLAQQRGDDGLRERALALFHRLRELDPDYLAELVASRLALLHTHAGRFEAATAEHDRALRRSLDPTRDWTELANLAESEMLTGALPRAVALYERSLELAQRNGSDATVGKDHLWVGVLSLWGLAVALDRLGERGAALERAEQAMGVGSGLAALRVLRDEQVFFEPREEVYWYEALGFEALARRDPERAAEHREEARLRWYRYLRAGGDDSPWADLARWHIARLEDDEPEP